MFNINLPQADRWLGWWLGGSEPLFEWKQSESCAGAGDSWVGFVLTLACCTGHL